MFDNSILNGQTRYGALATIEKSLEHYNPSSITQDEALVNQLRTTAGVPLPTY